MTGVLDMRIGDAVDGLLAVVAHGVVAGLGLVDRWDVLGVGHRVVMHRLVGDRPVVLAGLLAIDLLLLAGRGAGAGSCGRAALPAGQVDAAGDETGDEQGTRRDTDEDATLGLGLAVGGGLRFLSVVQTVLVIHGCPPFWDRAGAPHSHGRSARSMCSGLGLGVARDIPVVSVVAFIGCGILGLRGAAVLDAVVGAAAREHGECRDGDHDEEVVAAGLAEEPAGRRGGHGDRLPLIVDVLVLGDQNLGGLVALLGLLVQLLEHHEVVAVEGGGIELAEVDVDGAVLAVGRELEFGGDVLVVDGQHLAGLLVHERRLEGVFLARNQALVGHAVGDYRILTGHQRVVAVGLVRGGGADDGGHEVHGLLLGIEVAFGGDDDGGGTLLIRDRVLGHDLEHHDVLGLSAEAVDDIVGVEVEVHGHGAVVLLRGELGGLVDQMGDEVFVVGDELAEGIHVDGHRQLAGGGVVEHDTGVLEHGHVGDGFLLLIGQGIVAHLAGCVHGGGGQAVLIGLIGGVDDLEGAVRMDAHGLGLLHRTVLGDLIGDHDVGDTLILILRGESEHVEELLHERRDIRLGVLLAAIAREDGKAGLGIHEDTGHGVTDAGQGVLVGHIIGDGGLRIRDDVLVPIEAVGGRGGDARHMGGRGLLAVLDVGVGHKLDAVLLKALECDHLGVLRDAGGVEGEGHLDLAVALLGREGGLCGDGLAVHLKSLLRDVALLVGHLHMEAALQGVGLAGDDVLVLHGVDDRGLAVGHDVLVAVMAVQRGSADLRTGDRGGLLAVLDVRMAGDFNTGALKGLEDHDVRLVGDGAGVEGEGHLDLTAGGLRREGGLSRHRLAIHLKRLRREVAVLIGLLHLHGTLQGVLLARDEAGVFHGVHDDRLVIGDDVLVAVDAVQCGGGDERVLDRDGLRLILDVRMGGDFDAVLLKGLEGHDFRVVGDGQGVEVEHHIDLAVGLLGREGGLSGDGLAVHLKGLLRYLALLIGHLHMEGALQGVLLAGDEARVLHGVDDLGGVIGDDVLVAIRAIHGGGADFRMGHGDGLVLIVDVGVGCNLGAGAHKALGDHDVRLVLKVAGVEGEGHLDLAVGLLGREDGLARDGLVAHHQGLAVALGVELAVQGVLLAGDEVPVLHGVDDRGHIVHDHILVAVDGIACGSRDCRGGHGDGLVDVPDVLMGREHVAAALKGLEHDQLGAGFDVAGAEPEGHVGGAVGLLGGEGRLRLDGLAADLKGLRHGLAIFLGLHLHGTLQGVLPAGYEVFVCHGVDDDCFVVSDDVLILVDTVQRRGGDARVADGDRLPLILDVGVGREFMAVVLKGLERDEVRLVLEREGVEREGHVHGALGALGREGGFSRHGLTVHFQNFLGDLALIIGLLDVQGALDGVLLAGDEVLVGHTVGDGRLVVSRHVLVAVRAIHGGGADFRLDDGHLLVHVGLIGVLSDEGATIIVQLLIDRDGLAAEGDGVDGELHDLEPGGGLGRESLLHGDGVAGGVEQDIAGRGVVKLRRQLVVAVREEVGVGHLVGDLDLPHADEGIAVHRVVGLGGDGRLHVGEGAEVVHLAVATDDDRGLDELVALVGGAAQLLDGVGVVGQSALGVVGLRAAEPDASAVVQLGAVDDAIGLERPIVAVRLMGVLVPRGGGGEIAVPVGHGHMALARGLGGQLERDSREAVLTVIALLGEFEVAAHDLILERPVEGVHQHAVLGDAELMRLAVGEQVALTGLDLLNGVEAEGEPLRVGGRMAVLDGEEGLDDLPLGIGHAAHDDGLVVEALDLELGSVEGRAAERVAGAGLDVVLGYLHATANDVVLGVEGVDLAVLAHLHAHLGGSVEVGAVGLRLTDDVIAVGEGVGTGGGEALGIGRDDLHGLALGVGLAVHLHGVLVVVDDREADALKGGGALRDLAGLSIELLDGHAAALHGFGNLRHVEGGDTFEIIVLNLLETHFGIQLVASGCLGLVHGNRTTREDWNPILIVEFITRNDRVFIEIRTPFFISANYPRTGGIHTGLLESIVTIVVHGVEVLDGEFRALKGC